MRGVRSLMVLYAVLMPAAPAGAADKPIAFANYSYTPSDTTIRTGDTATFSGSFPDHPLVWDGGGSATTHAGSSKTFSFTQPGTYANHCQLHAQSQNMVRVLREVANQHPARVSFSVAPAQPSAGQPVTFTYTGDPDPDGALVRWEWDLDGDGTFETATPAGAA